MDVQQGAEIWILSPCCAMDPGTHTLQQLLEDQQAEEELLQLSAGTMVCTGQLMQSDHVMNDCHGLH
jgi:hypothetical protein